MTKKYLIIIGIIFFSITKAISQPDGYIFLFTIKQPYHTYNATQYQERKNAFQKVNEVKFSKSQQYLVISYAYNPTSLAIYYVDSWEQFGVYKVLGSGVELSSSYFDEDDKVMYVRYDRYATKYKRIDFSTGHIRIVPCKRTPKGCVYEEIKQDIRSAYTNNKKFYVEVSPFDASDVNVYIKKH